MTGNVSVGGTLTYEDVTNIDSVGLITARSGIHINNEAISGIGITINMSGINVSSGIITAPSFRAPYNGGFSMTQGQYNNGYYINSTGGNTLIGMAYYSNNTIGLGGNGSSLIPFKIDDVSQITLSPNTGNVALAYAGNTKLSTTSTGVNVTGAITVNGSALSITPTTSDIQIVYEITSSSSNSYYRFAGNGVDSSANNPDLYLERGKKYRFINNSGGNHPFRIQSDNSSTLYSTGVTNNNASTGNIDFAIRWDAPGHLYYKCGNHGAMLGNIYISSGQYNTQKNNPVFMAYRTSNYSVTGTPTVLVFNDEKIDVGGNYDTSNGRFTAPVTGLYEFGYASIASNSSTVYRYDIRINGSIPYGGLRQELRIDQSNNSAQYGTNGEFCCYLNMTVGQYAQVYVHADSAVNNVYGDSSYGYTYFRGRLIG